MYPSYTQFHSQELEKSQKAVRAAKEQQHYRLSQVAEITKRKKTNRLEDINYTRKNADLLKVYKNTLHNSFIIDTSFNHLCVKVEEEQFQQYASNLINQAEHRGAPMQPLVKAACVGTGGGHGPVYCGNGGMRPSYKVMDSTGVELPTYNPKPVHKDTQKRMGFTW